MAKKLKQKTTPNPLNLKYRIEDVIVSTYRCNPAPVQYINKTFELHFGIRCISAIALDLSNLRINIGVMVAPKEEQDKELLYVEIESVFAVLNMEEWVADGEVKLPDVMWNTLITVGIGSLRGALLVYSAATLYGKIVMPSINVAPLIPKDSFKIEMGYVPPTSSPTEP